MEYEKVKSKIIDNTAMIIEFTKCKSKLEKAVNVKIKELVNEGKIEIIELVNKFVIFKNLDNGKVYMYDSVGYVYDTKCHSKNNLSNLEEKNSIFYTNKFNNKKYKNDTKLIIPELIYYEEQDYIYVKNKECSTVLNQVKFVSRKLSIFYNNMVIKATAMGNYYRYSNGNKNDMVSNALLKILRKGFKFDDTKTDKMFSYFTYIITNDFNETTKKQYKLTNEMEMSLDSMISNDNSAND